MLTPQQIKIFQKEILNWYKKNRRDLPWRHSSLKLRSGLRDPYKILVSEVMLQQTQVQRVIPKYNAWLKSFPTLESLAKASTRDVLLHWSGLGYNRRALYLQKFAQTVMERFDDKIPQDEKVLKSLPGIGEYTARALLCFAFDKQIAVVDTNVRKVILTKFYQNHPEQREGSHKDNKISLLRQAQDRNDKMMMTNNEIQTIADQLLPKGEAYEWNQALMDYASVMLKKHKIPVPKQSKFKDSDRFFRGLIIRVLLQQVEFSIPELLEKICQTKKLDDTRYKKILLQLKKDRMIIQKGKKIMLPVG